MPSRVNHQRRLQTRRVRPGSRDPIAHNDAVRARKRLRHLLESTRMYHRAVVQAGLHLEAFGRALLRSAEESARARHQIATERSQEDRRHVAHALRDLGRELEGDTDA